MKTFKVPSTLRGPLVLAFTGLVLNSAPAWAADLQYDTQAQIQAVLVGAPLIHSTIRDERSASLDSRDAASSIEVQTLVRQFILGKPSGDVTQTQAAALNATTRLDGHRYADAQRQVQRTLQGGAG